MIWNIILLVTFITWLVIYIKNKKAIKALPYLLMLFITPIYNILDRRNICRYIWLWMCSIYSNKYA